MLVAARNRRSFAHIHAVDGWAASNASKTNSAAWGFAWIAATADVRSGLLLGVYLHQTDAKRFQTDFGGTLSLFYLIEYKRLMQIYILLQAY